MVLARWHGSNCCSIAPRHPFSLIDLKLGMLDTSAAFDGATLLLLLLFVFVTNVLNAIFTHVVDSRVLFGALLSSTGKMCYLQYVDDLVILTVPQIIKLIVLLFKGISGLSISFQKTCLYFAVFGHSLDPSLTKILKLRGRNSLDNSYPNSYTIQTNLMLSWAPGNLNLGDHRETSGIFSLETLFGSLAWSGIVACSFHSFANLLMLSCAQVVCYCYLLLLVK